MVSPPDINPLETAILEAVIYADVFDYPVTAQEIHRYLVACQADLAGVQQALERSLLPHGRLECRSGYFFLPGRVALVALRQRRAAIARALWRHARVYGGWIARLPFVRMVAVTGALAVDNVDDDADIDYLIVTEPGRLWVCRALVIGLVRWAGLRGHAICPNYFLSERALVIGERNLYTARELAQMVPIAGVPVYESMRRLNAWADQFLPNATGLPRESAAAPVAGSVVRSWLEGALRTSLGGRLEDWEMRRKVAKFGSRMAGASAPDEVAFCADWCKGHFDGHAHAVLHSFSQRLDQVLDRPARPQSVQAAEQ